MSTEQVLHLRPSGTAAERLRPHIEAIRTELEVTPAFPPEVQRAAEDAAADPRLPDLDRTDIPFVTVDPEAAMDLDQALHLARDGDGYLVHYAIADLTAFISPGDPLDLEANRRGQTLYGADSTVPLHPPVISADAGSLLPHAVRPAALWTIQLDAAGHQVDARVERALVRSVARYSYEQAQRRIDDDTAPDGLALLSEVGPRRIAIEEDRGGLSLPLPDQEIVVGDDDRWHLEYRALRPVEEWNAQLSLLTGFAAARMMLESGTGLLRTLPEPDPRDVARLRRAATALRVPWPAEWGHRRFVNSLDPTDPAHAAMLVSSTMLLRGSGYAGFADGDVPERPEHAALAAPYAHVTAPLRRLVDRYATEICLAHCAGRPVPGWVRERLDALPATMQRTGQLAGRYERMILDLVEAGVLRSRIGERFRGVVTDVDKALSRGIVTVEDPAIEAALVAADGGKLPLGTEVEVVLTVADLDEPKVEFALVDSTG